MNLAVDPAHRGKGCGSALIEAARKYAITAGARRLCVSTGNSSLDQLKLYQLNGFRMQSIKRDYFESYEPPIIENGIRCMDRVFLSMDLTP